MTNLFSTEVISTHQSNHARVLKINTPHGELMTPAFMPVGTRAAVNCLTVQELQQAGSEIILGGNTYHMLVTPGMEMIKALGGMHRLMGWHGPMLTDSGGFQVFSLSKNGKLCTIKEDGAHFKHPITGKLLHLTPETSITAQKIIGADIIMAFDECTPEAGGRAAALAAMDRTHRWLLQSKEIHVKNPCSEYGHRQALFGIIQGGRYHDLREKSAQFIVSAELDGIAIGGETIGFDMENTVEVIDWIRHLLPETKTRYTMGVGLHPQDLIDVVAAGVDIFDCVAPTRNARHGAFYSGRVETRGGWVTFVNEAEKGRLLIKKAIYAQDERPIVEGCQCYTCQHFTRAYLHFLFKTTAPLYAPLACIHNIYTMHEVCRQMRLCMM